ncbi:MAG: histidine phosphatase family protein [Chloroflexota bacterium]|nr:histidine phosphatase family protein [Chloroflexota bacterium]
MQRDYYTRFILIRHGQTGWNKEERFRGRVDVDLDETGFKQAGLVADHIADWGISAVYSSPLKRALNTASRIAGRLGGDVVTLDGINDMDFGDWQGLLISEVRERYAEQFDQWRYNPDRLAVPGGESLEDVRVRAVAIVDDLATNHEGETIAVVTHRVVCKVLLCHMLGLNNSHFWKIAQDSTAVNVFEIFEMAGTGERQATVTLMNDTCHLGN